MKQFLTCIIVLYSIYGNSQTVTNKTIQIDPYLTVEHYEHFKRLILNSPDAPVVSIENFNFEWGFQYKLRVKETKLEDELSDGTQYEYALVHIISKKEVSKTTEFKLFLDSKRTYHSEKGAVNHSLKKLNDATYLYFDKVEIEVPENLREQFKLIFTGKLTVFGTFRYIHKKRIKLIQL
ncbi:DUF4377 domain-containing protein [Kordia sp.]|uniref:DUF4377 domain-containing protein n=1 Tax=Kordia sp. TaxID=1965332 RepID=UPI003D6A8C35